MHMYASPPSTPRFAKNRDPELFFTSPEKAELLGSSDGLCRPTALRSPFYEEGTGSRLGFREVFASQTASPT